MKPYPVYQADTADDDHHCPGEEVLGAGDSPEALIGFLYSLDVDLTQVQDGAPGPGEVTNSSLLS